MTRRKDATNLLNLLQEVYSWGGIISFIGRIFAPADVEKEDDVIRCRDHYVRKPGVRRIELMVPKKPYSGVGKDLIYSSLSGMLCFNKQRMKL